jgi:hypothetical protein
MMKCWEFPAKKLLQLNAATVSEKDTGIELSTEAAS